MDNNVTTNKSKEIKILIGIIVFIFVGVFLAGSYAFFTFDRTADTNTIYTADVDFSFSDGGSVIEKGSVIPITTADIDNTATKSFSLTSHTTLERGISYNVYVAYGDPVNGKTRLRDDVVSFQFVPPADGNGFTTTVNNCSTPTSFTFTEDKVLIGSGVVRDTTALTTKDFSVHLFIDSNKISVSSTTKRANNTEGNPSLADATTGTTTAARYMKNNINESSVVTLYPAKESQQGKIIYTTNEFSNSYYSYKIIVEANEAPLFGEDKVRDAIEAKINAETNACNPTYVEDGITYFSGDNTCVDMNYVWYSGKLWRITAIYPNGAMKLVTENIITTIYYGDGDKAFYTDANTTSYMYQWLNEDFYDTLYNANNIIDNTKEWDMGTASTISSKPVESVNISANVGLLNSYEYYNSYRCIDNSMCTGTNYSTGYLNSDSSSAWWLLNPAHYSNSLPTYWVVSGGSPVDFIVAPFSVRPSIYLKSGLDFIGNGTSNSPYKIVGDKAIGKTNDLINTRVSGEYVKLKNGNNEQVFRIIGVEDNKTKIISMDYAANNAKKVFAAGNTNGDGTIYGSGQTTTQGADTWYNYLTETYYPNLLTTYGELFDSGTYYMGQVNTSGNYKLGICSTATGNTKTCIKTSQTGIFNVGLPRYGEMFAVKNDSGSVNGSIWLINRESTSSIDIVGSIAYSSAPTSSNLARPTLHLKSTVKILSGSGTESDPYVVGVSS